MKSLFLSHFFKVYFLKFEPAVPLKMSDHMPFTSLTWYFQNNFKCLLCARHHVRFCDTKISETQPAVLQQETGMGIEGRRSARHSAVTVHSEVVKAPWLACKSHLGLSGNISIAEKVAFTMCFPGADLF